MSEPTIVGALQALYDSIARRSPDLTFLNFGFADPASPPGAGDLQDLEAMCRGLYEALLTPFPAAQRVLEIACGRGGGAGFLLEQQPHLSSLGIDLSPEHVRLCRDRFRTRPNAQFALGNASRLPVPGGRFDAAFSLEACHHFEDIEGFYGEVARALRPGGWFFLSGIWQAGKDSAAPIEAKGFRVVERADISPNVVASLERSSPLRTELVDRLNLPDRFRQFLLSWAGVSGSGSYQELASGERLYLRYRLQRV
jgi:SAM-dependent methyltransferase